MAAQGFIALGEPFDDLVQVGNIGLIGAIDRFEPSRGLKFTTFALPTIAGEIRRYYRDKVAAVKVPRPMRELSYKVTRAADQLTSRFGRDPSEEEIAEHLSIHVGAVRNAIRVALTMRVESLDAEIGDSEGGMSRLDVVGSDDPGIKRVVEHADLQHALSLLSETDQKLLRLHYFDEKTQHQIAEAIGISQMQVSRLLRRAVCKLRTAMTEPEKLERIQPKARKRLENKPQTVTDQTFTPPVNWPDDKGYLLDQEQRVLELTYSGNGAYVPPGFIAKEMQISKQRVYQIRGSVLNKLAGLRAANRDEYIAHLTTVRHRRSHIEDEVARAPVVAVTPTPVSVEPVITPVESASVDRLPSVHTGVCALLSFRGDGINIEVQAASLEQVKRFVQLVEVAEAA
jgi:RNA polymerase sigma-B factor